MSLVLNAARRRVESGKPCPRLYLLHADTGVENSAMVELARGEVAKIRAYARRYGICLDILIAEPSLNEGFATRVLSGRALPSFHDTRLRRRTAASSGGT
ncbi:hypothetical protein K2O51_30895 (plasmid) [Cupriavidus pinatubonensis]|uniref:hypothetical protein n=1 Tax=Cupriavidus pinatubonensis TaxID=248026 RepID=UPI001C72F743|nr:hypothetical protein [Cupriavidus pinatubonensis]QYY33657.1 hypothetical protein K2O51_30895 [Cupriavidus pinatubonensis]